jgi:outer membrane biosynthesis protein TonB
MGPDYFGNEEPFDRQFQFISAASLWLAWYEMTTLWPLEREERKELRKNFLLKVSAVLDDSLRSGPFLEMLRRFLDSNPAGQVKERPSEATGKAGPSDSRANEAMEEALQELMKALKEKGEAEKAKSGGDDQEKPAPPPEIEAHKPAPQENTGTPEVDNPAPREIAGRTNEAHKEEHKPAPKKAKSEKAKSGRTRAKSPPPPRNEEQTPAHQENAGGDTAGGAQTSRNGEVSERLVRELQETNTQLRELLAMQREMLERTASDKQRNYGESRNGS